MIANKDTVLARRRENFLPVPSLVGPFVGSPTLVEKLESIIFNVNVDDASVSANRGDQLEMLA